MLRQRHYNRQSRKRRQSAIYILSWAPSTYLSNPNICMPTASPVSSTMFYVEVTDSLGCKATDSIFIKANPALFSEAGKDTTICKFAAVVIGKPASGGTPPYKYTWKPSQYLDDENAMQPIASPSVSTKFYVSVADSVGCVSTDSVLVNINSSLIAEAGNDTTICNGSSIIIGKPVAGGKPPYVYLWSPKEYLNNPNIAQPTATLNEPLVFYLQITDSVGCTAFDSIRIQMLSNLDSSAIVCKNSSIKIGKIAKGGIPPYIYLWTPAEYLDNPNIAQPIASPVVSTMFHVKIKDGAGCISNDSILIKINSELTVDAGPDTNICFNSALELSGKVIGGTPPYKYFWTSSYLIDNPNLETIKVNPRASTMFILRVVDSVACTKTDTVFVKVLPELKINLGDDKTLCKGKSAIIGRSASGGVPPYKYLWAPIQYLDNPNIAQPTTSPETSIKYTLRVIDSRGCSIIDSLNINLPDESQLVLNKPYLDFGILDPCKSSKVDSIVITNNSSDYINIKEIQNSSNFSLISPALPISLAPLQKRTIVIRFFGAKIGQSVENIKIVADPCNIIKTFECKATKSEMLVSSSLTSINFGQSLSCLSVSKDTSFILKNTSVSDISFDFSGISLKTPYALISPKTTKTLSANDSILVSLHYQPLTFGNFIEDLNIPFISGLCKDTFKISMIGSHIKPELSISAKSLNFPDMYSCQNYIDTLITIRNENAIDIDILTIEHDSSTSTTSSYIKIHAGDTALLPIRFMPKVIGSNSGALIIKYEPCGLSDTIQVFGNKKEVAFYTKDSIDFEELTICKEASKTLNLQIENKSSAGIIGIVKSIQNISSPFKTTLKEGDTLINGIANNFNISVEIDSLTPDGLINGSLDFLLSPCDSIFSIKLFAKKTSVNLICNDSLNYGLINVSNFKDDTLHFINKGTASVLIDSLENITSPFKLIKTIPQLPLNLAINQELLAIIRYTPIDTFNNELICKLQSSIPCNITKNILLLGKGNLVQGDAKCVIYIASNNANNGEITSLPMILRNSENLITNDIPKEFTAKLRFNASLLYPLFETINDTIDGNERIIEVNGSIAKSTGIMKEMNYYTALGNAKCTGLIIDTLIWKNIKAELETENGEFCLNDICYEGGARLVNPNSKARILSIQPNPSSEELVIEYQATETGKTELLLINNLGAIVRNISYSEISDFNKKIETIKLNDLSSGQYLLIFKTPTQIDSHKVIILK